MIWSKFLNKTNFEYLISIREQAQAHQLSDLIADRNETIHMLDTLMRDINDMTGHMKE